MSTNNTFKLVVLFVVIGLSGAALRVAEQTPEGVGLSLNQQLMPIGLISAFVCEWLLRHALRSGKPQWVLWVLRTALTAAVVVTTWAFWPVVVNVFTW